MKQKSFNQYNEEKWQGITFFFLKKTDFLSIVQKQKYIDISVQRIGIVIIIFAFL